MYILRNDNMQKEARGMWVSFLLVWYIISQDKDIIHCKYNIFN